MNRFLLLFSFALTALGVSAQKRTVFTELGGAANGISANFDSRLAPNSHWGYNVGLGYSNDNYSNYYRYSLVHLSLPVRMYYLVGKSRHHFELGAGVVSGVVQYSEKHRLNEPQSQSFLEADRKQFRYYFTTNLGYRFQPKQGLLLRVGLSVNACEYYDDYHRYFGIVRPYLSLGYAF